ncbi:preprotein translocase subunit Tim44 [Rhodobacter veldkampii DSM 11550]|uniref:Preprotein translocase subunit Tim44 n=1 Tax=Phaeovulum veldkampii DSM 11550 TaxID=1185920 RepID=A0A2T4JJ63_9RHOB|nr:Tim44/TimA family putative adaptor protein [Phaeovulum veldkampii]MBK5947299.1 preprotein translocase subunit Tim44 [Phaeovulum veldkampii DSM 11550]NCU19952.1 Tim44 domain-containing protein [Candidatus Falkowbacteria bacterium]PTE17949.1 preprotein translocase subunit Tim44 [Phaeovulum veldkampii DSM 11550]TDQ56695.1 putative lipid-binding transport protein (Tim44 family) [Phaeovulum veldkampii DSM 11550]
MSNAVIQLLVLAAVAIFLILRLKNVLGTRDGFEKPVKPVVLPDDKPARRSFEVIDGGADRDIIDHVPEGSDAARALAAMKQVEPKFSVNEFLQGARGAYEMILMAFERGDLEKVRAFLAPEVYDAFDQVVETRATQGLKVQADFLGLRELALHDAHFDRTSGEAEVTVRFMGELVSVARNAAGDVVEGDPKASRKQRDVWTFARKMGSADPNWQLVATGG